MGPQHTERRGEEARQLLENELYKEAWQMVRERIILSLENQNLAQDDRKHLNNVLVGLRDARRYLEQVMVSGTLAAKELERKRTMAERLLRR